MIYLGNEGLSNKIEFVLFYSYFFKIFLLYLVIYCFFIYIKELGNDVKYMVIR